MKPLLLYKNLKTFISNFEANEREMTKYILGTINELDQPKTHMDRLNAAINKLSLKDKNFLYLKYHQLLTFKEISKVLHISESTAKRKFERIKEILKKEINDGR